MSWTLHIVALLFIIGGAYAAKGQYKPMQSEGEIPEHFRYSPTERYEASILPGSAYRERNARLTEMNFLNSTHYWVNDLMLSGNVVYGNVVDRYLHAVLDKIIEANDLDVDVQIHPIKSSYYNAFSTDLGYIFVNLGLVAKVRNEAELAFVLSHELVHYIYSHNLLGVRNTYELEKRQGGSSYQRLLERHSYSRDLEFEADSIGYQYYLNAGYRPKEALAGFELLEDPRHLPEGIALQKMTAFVSGFDTLDAHLIESLNKEITEEVEVDDSLRTHPAAQARQMRLFDRTESMDAGDVWLVSKDSFYEARKAARLECARVAFRERNYFEAAMYSEAIEELSGDTAYAEMSFLRSMIGLLASKIYDPEASPYDYSVQSLYAMRLSEESAYLPALLYFRAMDSLGIVNNIEGRFVELEEKYPESEALQRLKNWYIDWVDDAILDDYDNLFSTQLGESDIPENALRSEKKFYLDPMYLFIDFRKKYKIQFKETERNKERFLEKTKRKDKRKGLYEFFSASDKSNLNTETINGIALMRERVREMNAIPGGPNLPPLEVDYIRDFCEKHGRSVVRFSLGTHYKENHNPAAIATAYLYIYTAPIALVKSNTAKNRAYFDFADFDLITGDQRSFSAIRSKRGIVRRVFFKYR